MAGIIDRSGELEGNEHAGATGGDLTKFDLSPEIGLPAGSVTFPVVVEEIEVEVRDSLTPFGRVREFRLRPRVTMLELVSTQGGNVRLVHLLSKPGNDRPSNTARLVHGVDGKQHLPSCRCYVVAAPQHCKA